MLLVTHIKQLFSYDDNGNKLKADPIKKIYVYIYICSSPSEITKLIISTKGKTSLTHPGEGTCKLHISDS